jgi:histidyl-tRNA synthetase
MEYNKMPRFQTLRGMRDFLPEDLKKRRYVEETIRRLFDLYGYEEIDTPIVESIQLVTAKAGDEIRHRMYSFRDLGGREIALRPEMTAPVARLVVNHLKSSPKPLRLGYVSNCFRYDEPQQGRYREFWQGGFELFGSSRPEADAEILIIADHLMTILGFQSYEIKINHFGILREVFKQERIDNQTQDRVLSFMDRNEYNNAIALLKEKKISSQCIEVSRQLFETKLKSTLDTLLNGEEILKNYRKSLQALNNLRSIVGILNDSGINIPLSINYGFGRGLEYYTGMVFEVFVPELGIALNGGGRYDQLMETFGGDPIPAVGCAPGIDRIVLAMNKKKLFKKEEKQHKVLVIALEEELQSKALEIAQRLRNKDLHTEVEVTGRRLRRALSYASNTKFTHTIIIGRKELSRNSVIVRNMTRNEQVETEINKILDQILK